MNRERVRTVTRRWRGNRECAFLNAVRSEIYTHLRPGAIKVEITERDWPKDPLNVRFDIFELWHMYISSPHSRIRNI